MITPPGGRRQRWGGGGGVRVCGRGDSKTMDTCDWLVFVICSRWVDKLGRGGGSRWIKGKGK